MKKRELRALSFRYATSQIRTSADSEIIERIVRLTLDGYDARKEFDIKPTPGRLPSYTDRDVWVACDYWSLRKLHPDQKEKDHVLSVAANWRLSVPQVRKLKTEHRREAAHWAKFQAELKFRGHENPWQAVRAFVDVILSKKQA